MAVITISRQYGSGGNQIAIRLCEMLGYRYFDKNLMAEVAIEAGLSHSEVVDYSEDAYKVRTLLDHMYARFVETPKVARAGIWKKDSSGALLEEVSSLDEEQTVSLVGSTIFAAHELGNVVIVGRGGQIILKDMSDVLHVRVEAPLDMRVERLQTQEELSPDEARRKIDERDRAAADYLQRFYDTTWDDPLLYDLTINMRRFDAKAAARLMINAVSELPAEV